MLKVLVIGSPGAGKSTFARKLSAVTGLPLYYLDLLWHKPDKTNLAAEEFDLRLNEMMEKLSGSLMEIISGHWNCGCKAATPYSYWIFHWRSAFPGPNPV